MTRPDCTVSARVPADLRADLVKVCELRGDEDLSATIRWALRTAADQGLAGAVADDDPRLFYAQPGATVAAVKPQAPRSGPVKPPGPGTMGAGALEVIATASAGATVDEIEQHLERREGRRIPTNGLARRVTDLLQAGAITTAIAVRGDQESRVTATRITRNGRAAQVYVITDLGRAWRDANRQDPR